MNIVTATIASVDMATGSQDTMHDVEEISYDTLMSHTDRDANTYSRIFLYSYVLEQPYTICGSCICHLRVTFRLVQIYIHLDAMNIACTFRHLHKVYCTKCNEYTEFVFLKDNVYNI